MKKFFLLLLSFCFVSAEDLSYQVLLPRLQEDLAQMVAKDQEARSQINVDVLSKPAEEKNEAILQKMQKIDAENLVRLKNIILEYGWPTTSQVGEEGVHNMWLLLQHADSDLEFQKKCLRLIEEAVLKNEASKKGLAYLKDRILVHEGKRQLYGTQATVEKGQIQLKPIEDIENVDKRRHEMGLEPLSEYLSLLQEFYSAKH